jgi:hypothetical protein
MPPEVSLETLKGSLETLKVVNLTPKLRLSVDSLGEIRPVSPMLFPMQVVPEEEGYLGLSRMLYPDPPYKYKEPFKCL